MSMRPSDARVNEAKAMLSAMRSLDDLTQSGLAAQFNLPLETAFRLMREEYARRRQYGPQGVML